MSFPKQSSVFGRRKEPHTIIIARGDSIRHFTIRPWMIAVAGSFAMAAFIGYLGATTYLVMRDDLIGATVTRQARMQQVYEDRISALRTQIDRVTSRQMLDQQLMEDKVAELMTRQAALTQRHGRLGPILEKALGATSGADPVPVPSGRPDERASLETGDTTALAYAGAIDPMKTGSVFDAILKPNSDESAADRADRAFIEINRTLRTIEGEQVAKLQSLTEETWRKAEAIAVAASDAGINLRSFNGDSGTGGPLLHQASYDGTASSFETHVEELDTALTVLDKVKAEVDSYPLASPAPGKQTTSGFGYRSDPFLGTRAMHSGIDFRGAVGEPIRATAAGTVVRAGWNGGYGRMVEIDHGNGFTTRYAHMSDISVAEGAKVEVGATVGLIGSSGRSTGPHLHYEVRKDGNAVDPLKFLKTGSKVRKLL